MKETNRPWPETGRDVTGGVVTSSKDVGDRQEDGSDAYRHDHGRAHPEAASFSALTSHTPMPGPLWRAGMLGAFVQRYCRKKEVAGRSEVVCRRRHIGSQRGHQVNFIHR
jgi:hypothetical protein